MSDRSRAVAGAARTTVRMGIALIVALCATPGAANAQEAPSEASLVRCVAGRSRPCLTTSVDLAPEVVRRTISVPAESLAAAWRARLLGDTGLVGRGAKGRTGAARDNRLLVLVDISGTMRNLGIGTVRLALHDFLNTFDSLPRGAVRVAVAAFGSVGVANRINNAVFTTPDSARLAVDALPTPDRENTGLYSAVELGMGRLAKELQGSESAGIGVLMLVTDGTENDVGRPGDDPGLLAGPEGLRRAARAVDQSGMVAAIIGIGAGDQSTLAALAGSRGRKYLVGLDAYQLGTAFREIRDLFWSSWDLAFPLQVSREALGRGFATLTPRLASDAEAGVTAAAVWRPPVVALPAFAGVAPEALVPAGTAGEGAGFVLDRRIPLALMVVVLSALLWFVVPRMLWPPLVTAAAAAEPVAPSRPAKVAPVAAGGLRTDVKEVAPRRPTDVTAAKARRAR